MLAPFGLGPSALLQLTHMGAARVGPVVCQLV